MKRELLAYFDLIRTLNEGDSLNDNDSQNYNKTLLDALSNRPNNKLPPEWDIPDLYARIQILTQTQVSDNHVKWIEKRGEKTKTRRIKAKEYARMGSLQHNMPSGLFWLYYNDDSQNLRGSYQNFLCRRVRLMDKILQHENLHNAIAVLLFDLFPKGAWTLRIKFTLKKPYISKDDTAFYIIDNPVKKEWVFKVPYVAPSQWKGALRSAMIRELVNDLYSGQKTEEEFVWERLRLYRLFGNEKDGTEKFLDRALTIKRIGPRPTEPHQAKKWEENYKQVYSQISRKFEEELHKMGYRKGDIEGFQGCLHFYPTYFDQIGMEVINPHDRKTGVGKNPIYFECVPADTQGVFQLLYIPLGYRKITNEKEAIQEAESDLKTVAHGIHTMLTKYGFGAKTSSGFGVAKVESIQVTPKEWRKEVIEKFGIKNNHERT